MIMHVWGEAGPTRKTKQINHTFKIYNEVSAIDTQFNGFECFWLCGATLVGASERQCSRARVKNEPYPLHCSQRVGVSEHDPQLIPLFQGTLQGKEKRNRKTSLIKVRRDSAKPTLWRVQTRPVVAPHPVPTWQLAQLMSVPLASKFLRKAGRSLGSDTTLRTSVTPPVMSTMASWGKPISRAL